MLYAIDKWGRVHFGKSHIEILKKIREAESDGRGNNIDMLEIIKSKRVGCEEKKEQKINNRNINYLD